MRIMLRTIAEADCVSAFRGKVLLPSDHHSTSSSEEHIDTVCLLNEYVTGWKWLTIQPSSPMLKLEPAPKKLKQRSTKRRKFSRWSHLLSVDLIAHHLTAN